MKKVTMQSLADELGISKVAVFKALKNEPGVSAGLRERVTDLANLRGYRLKEYLLHKLTFLFIIRSEYLMMESEIFYTSIYNRMRLLLSQDNASHILCLYDSSGQYLKTINESKHKLKGVFICGELPLDVIQYIKNLNLPMICIDNYNPTLKISSVFLNYYYNGFELTTYLLDQGHTKIGFVGQLKFAHSITDRYYGYRRALASRGIPHDNAYHIKENIDKSTKFDIVFPKDMPTAFICYCDAAARKLYMALRYYNYRIPEDISVVSFDDTALALTLDPPLTSMGMSQSLFADAALELMIEKIKNPESARDIILSPRIVERNSVK